MIQIALYQRAMKELTRKEFLHIEKSDAQDYSSSHNMLFKKAIDGKSVSYGSNTQNTNDYIDSLISHKNKQYQWLLSEAFEEFQICLQKLYAYASYMDNSFWHKNDYDSIANKDFKWFEENAKKEKTHRILNKFRTNLKPLNKIEKHNKLGVNLRIAISLIESFRHIIVHNGGTVFDKVNFKVELLQRCELKTNSAISMNHSDFIDYSFFGNDKFENTITLVEYQVDKKLRIYKSRTDELHGYLIAYIDLLCDLLKSHFTDVKKVM